MTYKIVNILTFVLVLVMNYLANALPLNGKTTGELSAQYPNLFVPAGITFSIWGIIYLLLLVFLILQFSGPSKTLVMAIGLGFAVSNFFNAGWIVAWHYEKLPLSLVFMLGILVSLIFANLQLKDSSLGIIKAAFGIYLGWILIASIANLTAVLVNYNWSGWGISEQNWAIIMIVVGALISIVSLIKLNNPFLALAVIWAFAGIILNRKADFPAIALVAVVGIVAVGVFMILGFRKFYHH